MVVEGRQTPLPVTSTSVPFSCRGCSLPRKCTSKVSHQKSALVVADIAVGSVENLLEIKWSMDSWVGEWGTRERWVCKIEGSRAPS